MASLVLKPMIPNCDLLLDLLAVSAFTRNGILINQSGIFWSTSVKSSVTWTLSPTLGRTSDLHNENLAKFHSSQKRRCPNLKIILSFLLLIAPLLYPSSCRNLPFCIACWTALLVARWDAVRFMNCLIETIRSSNLLGWILFFNSFDQKLFCFHLHYYNSSHKKFLWNM